MTPEDIAWLRTPEGAAACVEAADALAAGRSELAVIEALRRRLTPERVRAVLALLDGRRAARAKCANAGSLFFDRESAEQATSEVVARHTAARFAGASLVADLGCGAGGDALALAEVSTVVAIDRDPTRVALVAANASVRGLGQRIDALEGSAEDALPDGVDAVWLDPARRDEGGRTLDPEAWSPPLSVALRIALGVARAGIKVAPGIDHNLVPPGAEMEFISVAGNLVEAVIWLGAVVSAPRRATVLPEGASISGEPDTGATPIAAPGAYLYDLDPSVGRANLVDVVAPTLDAWRLDEAIAYLSGDEPRESPFARRFRVLAWFPFAERRILDALREAGASRVEVMRRGSPVETNPLEVRLNRALSGRLASGEQPWTVALTRASGEHIAIVCRRER
ncbi:MAG: methyltransferase domain-containing protein [Chloroflexi bacterium]|nr:methyltransferase domain-containing protein [Chloroflexota bacterium]MDA1240205.1 methyltransferase domain-containing protein [Chloroflexota bacterium]MQC47819.1 class I SAM-dependent methyltransferase [Chloroflexota bacterium]